MSKGYPIIQVIQPAHPPENASFQIPGDLDSYSCYVLETLYIMLSNATNHIPKPMESLIAVLTNPL